MKRAAFIFIKTFIALVLVYSFAGFFLLPYFVQFYTPMVLKKSLNTDSYIDSVHLNPFNSHIRLDNFIIKDQNHKNLLFFEKLILNIDPLKLLENKIVLKNIKLENLKIDVDLDTDKKANFQYILDALAKNGTEESAPRKSEPKAFEVLINRFDIKDMVLVFTDRSKKEPFNVTTKPIDLPLSNIAIKAEHINKLALNIDTLETGNLRLNSDIVLSPLSAKGDLQLLSININKIFNYVKTEDMGFDISSAPLDLYLDYDYKNAGGVQSIDLSNITSSLPKIAYITQQFDIEGEGIKKSMGSFSLDIGEKVEYKGENILASLKALTFKDNEKNREFTFGDIKSSVESISGDKKLPMVINTSLETPSKGSLEAGVKLLREPVDIEVKLALKSVDIKPYEEYLKDFVNLDINSLELSSDSDIRIALKEDIADIEAKSDINLKSIDISNSFAKQEIAKIKGVDIKGLTFKKDDLYIKDILVNEPYVAFYRNSNDTTNFSNIVKEKEAGQIEEEKTEDEQKLQPQKEKSAFKYQIENITIKNGQSLFADDTVTPAFKSVDEKIEASIKNVTSDKNILTTITHKGIVDKYASIDIDTKLIVSDPLEKVDANVVIQNIDLPSLSPYSGKFIGNKLSNGKFGLNVEVKIDKGNLANKNKIKIKDIELGEKVESKDAIDAPVGLAIALLEDSRGYIDLDIPIDGNVKDPNFHLGDVITDVITNTLVGIISAPFKFLALIVGIEGDDISKLEFSYGKSDIEVTQREKLDGIVKAFKERPNLKLIVKPAIIEQKDRPVLKQKKFEQAFKELFDEKLPNEQKFIFAKEKYMVLFKEESYKKLEEKYKEKKIDELYSAMVKKLESIITVSDEELKLLAKQRTQGIKNYLVKNGLGENRVLIADEVKQAVFDSKIDKVTVEFEVDVK